MALRKSGGAGSIATGLEPARPGGSKGPYSTIDTERRDCVVAGHATVVSDRPPFSSILSGLDHKQGASAVVGATAGNTESAANHG
jgi:hypothetical protein